MLAVLGAFAFAAMSPAGAQASHGVGGASQCDDNVDNDFDLLTDHDGGPFGPLLKDPNCSGPGDDSEAASSTCSVCVNFATEWDPDGPGGSTAVRRYHPNLIANVPYSLDVNGNLGDLAGGMPIPGYEIRVVVEGTSATTPTIRIEKLTTAPPTLPLRTEIVIGSPTMTSFGYDTLDATAPRSFVAALNLSDRDGNVNTTQALVNLAVAGAGRRLTLVNEQFGGNPVGERTNRHIRRATLIGDPARGTTVPTSARLDLTTSATRTHIHLTHNLQTTLEFLLDEPGTATDSSGRLDKLPPTVDLDIADVDVNGDGKLDQGLAYEADALATADVHIDSPFKRDNGDGTFTEGRTKTDAHVVDLPLVTNLTYATPSPNRTEVTYSAEQRATSATIKTDDGSQQFAATVENLPYTIEELTYATSPGDADLTYLADEVADHVHVETRQGDREFDADVDDLPTEVGIHVETPATDASPDIVRLEYNANAIVPHASIRTEDVLEDAPVPPETEPTLHRRELMVTANGVEPGTGLARSVEFQLDNDEKTVSYIASDSIPEIRVKGTDEAPFFERANELNLLIEDLPSLMSGKFVSDFLELDAHGGTIGKVEILGNTPGDTAALPSGEDGVLIRDLADAYTLFGRIRGLTYARYVDHGAHALSVDFDATPPPGTDARVDVETAIERAVWTNVIGGEDVSQVRPGTEKMNILLRDYPTGIDFDLDGATGSSFIDYTADEPAGRFDFFRETRFTGGVVPVVYKQPYTAENLTTGYQPANFTRLTNASLIDMPASFHVCQVDSGSQCSGTTWTDGMFEDFDPDTEANGGSIGFSASPRTRLVLHDHEGGKPVPITYMRDRDEVEDAGHECETPSAYVVPGSAPPAIRAGCLYEDTKPGFASKDIDLTFGDLVIQNHLESSGWVGHNIADIFSDGNNQGYVAMDTSWEPEGLTGEELCFALGFEDPSPCGPGGELEGEMGFFPPEEDDSVSGTIAKGGHFCVEGEPKCLPEELEAAFPLGFAGKVDAVSLGFGSLFGADHRVFEFDPDELVFAIHEHGRAWCDENTDLQAGPSSITDYMCSGMIRLDPPEE